MDVEIQTSSLRMTSQNLDTIPHPAEDQMHLRIQTVEDYPAQTALKTALQDLKSLAVLSKQKFLDDVDRYKKENPDCQKKEEPAV